MPGFSVRWRYASMRFTVSGFMRGSGCWREEPYPAPRAAPTPRTGSRALQAHIELLVHRLRRLLAGAADRFGRNAGNRAARRHIAENHGPRSDPRLIAHRDVAQHFGACAD